MNFLHRLWQSSFGKSLLAAALAYGFTLAWTQAQTEVQVPSLWDELYAWAELHEARVKAQEAEKDASSLHQQDPVLQAVETQIDKLLGQLESSAAANERQGLTLQESSPFPWIVVGGEFGKLYQAAYDSELQKALADPPVEPIFDAFMKMIVEGTAPASMRDSARQIGPKLARKVLQGKTLKCPLDLSEKIQEPKKVTLFWMKYGWMSPCRARITLFNASKAELLKARFSPEVQKEVRAAFPAEFQKQFFVEIGRQIESFPQMVSKKFRGSHSPLWKQPGGLVAHTPDGVVSVSQVMRSVRAEMRLAQILLSRADRLTANGAAIARGRAAALFYGAANRLLLFAGAKRAYLESTPAGTALAVEPISDVTKVPTVKLVPSGGWSVRQTDTGMVYEPWNFETDLKEGQKLVPTQIILDRNGAVDSAATQRRIGEPVQELEVLTQMLKASAVFLELTHPDSGAFREYFGPQDNASELLNPESKMIFPHEGRSLAVGVLATAAQALVNLDRGHIEKVPHGLRISFRDPVSFSKRGSQVKSASVGDFLSAIPPLIRTFSEDPAVPPELKEQAPLLDTVLAMGALVLGRYSQEGQTGRFSEFLQEHVTPQTPLLPRSLVRGVLGFTSAYERAASGLMRARLLTSWTVAIPEYLEDAKERPNAWIQSHSRVEALEFLRLWEETTIQVMKDLGVNGVGTSELGLRTRLGGTRGQGDSIPGASGPVNWVSLQEHANALFESMTLEN